MKFQKSVKYTFILIIGLALLSCLASCTNENKASDDMPAQIDSAALKAKDSIVRVGDTIIVPDFPLIRYEKIYIKNSKELNQILARFPKAKDSKTKFDTSTILTTLNRKEYRYFRVGDTIVVPDKIVTDIRAYSVFPPFFEGAKDIPKFILISNKYQCYACYQWGKLVRFAAANTGKERTATYPGRYALVWKERLRISSLNEDWKLPYTWNFHREAGNAFHQFDMPGRPVSHSCVRQFMEDAKWLFYWGQGEQKDSSGKYIPLSGTPVIILDIFDFSRKRGGPWWDLKTNKDSVISLPEKPMEVEEALIPYCQIPKTSRSVLRNRQRYLYAEDTLRARGIIREGVTIQASIDFNQQKKEKKAREEKAKKEAMKKG